MRNDAFRPTRRDVLTAVAGIGALGAARAQADEFGDATLRGAGSTLVQPLMEAWVQQYRADPFQVMRRRGAGGGLDDDITNDSLDYEAVGSLAGIQRIRAGFVDFASSEMPLRADYLKRSALMQFAWVIGGIAITVNLPGVRALKLDANALAGIFMGRIKRWSNASIVAQNPGVALPDEQIVVMHRSDGSGSTYTLANYLSRTDAEWSRTLGTDLTLKWPVGKGINGGSALAAAVKSTPHSIGYVSTVQALQNGLTVAALRNRGGVHVLPAKESIAAAVAIAPPAGDAFEHLPIDSAGELSYPIVATVFGLMSDPVRSARQRRTAEFVRWTLTRGASLASTLGYVSLPEHLAQATLKKLFAT